MGEQEAKKLIGRIMEGNPSQPDWLSVRQSLIVAKSYRRLQARIAELEAELEKCTLHMHDCPLAKIARDETVRQLPTFDRVCKEVDRLAKIVAKLPKTADGVPITGPDMDVWVHGWPDGSIVMCPASSAQSFDECWSTEWAARAAAGVGEA